MRKAALLISGIILLQISLNTGDAQESDSTSTPDVARLVLALMGANTPTMLPTPTPTQPTPTPTATQPTPTSTPSHTPTETPVPKCFPHDTAYLIGEMNIREKPTTNSKRVGATNRGEAYKVSDAYEGDDYCWLKTDKGWIAHISYVSHDISDILPRISGNVAYKNKVVRAFKYIHDRSTKWFDYTVPKIGEIVFAPDLGKSDNQADTNATMYVRQRKMELSERYMRSVSTTELASTLIHEACHVHQWDRGDRYLVSFLAEPECYSIEADALSQLSPGHPDVPWLRCWAKHYPSTFLCKYEVGGQSPWK